MSQLKAMKAVYSYHFPEVRLLLHEVSNAIPDNMRMVTTPAKDVYKALEPVFDPPLCIPSTLQGYVNLDEIHVPVIERMKKSYLHIVPGLSDLPYSYPTPGSSEGIYKLLTKLKVDGTDAIYVLFGEYEGYGEYAGPEDLKMKVITVDTDKTDPKKLEPGVWFVSNPSARDGNIIPNEFITGLCDYGHKVILDLAYAGSTRPYEFDVTHENIPAVVMSLSKPDGLFWFRIGYVFSREPVHSLFGNKWFKDPERLLQGLKVTESIKPGSLYEKYSPLQKEIISGINEEFGLGMRASDVLLLGYLTEDDVSKLDQSQLDLIPSFRRGSGYRFCLTPYFEEKERGVS